MFFFSLLSKTPNQFWTDFVSNLTALNYLRSEAIRQAGFAYDSVWLAALALHNASMELENRTNGTRRLSDFTYADNEINHIILSSAIGVNFRGVTVSSDLHAFSVLNQACYRVFQESTLLVFVSIFMMMIIPHLYLREISYLCVYTGKCEDQ